MIFKKLNKRLARIYKRINDIFVLVQPVDVAESERDFLVVYHWFNDISNKRGDSSVIITLKSGEYMTKDYVKDLQDTILNKIRNLDHPDDPTELVIVNIIQLESDRSGNFKDSR